jgi:hypothetical protein
MSTRAPRGYRLARSSSVRPCASRHWPRFGRLTCRGSDALDARRTRCRNQPVTPMSPVEFSSTGAGFLFRPMPLSPPPRERQPFSRHWTPSASKQPSSGSSVSPRVAAGFDLSTPFHSRLPFFAGLLPRARSPWAPPAATVGACLDLTPLPDFCNHTEGRAHWTDVRTSSKAPFLALPRPSSPKGSGIVERRGESSAQERRPGRPKSSESACARRQQRPTRAPSSAPVSSFGLLLRLEPSRAGRPTKTHPRTCRANGTGPWRGRGHFPPSESPGGLPFLRTVTHSPPEGESQDEHAFFTNPSCPS